MPDSTPMDILAKELDLQIGMEDRVELLEEKLKKAKAQLHIQNTKTTPLAMAVADVKEFVLQNGFKVTMKPFVEGSIDKEDPHQAYDDIRDRGEEALIKWTVTLAFGKDEEEKAKSAQDLLKEHGYEPAASLGVHYQSLQAYLRRHFDDEGFQLQTLYNGSAGMRVKINRPKR